MFIVLIISVNNPRSDKCRKYLTANYTQSQKIKKAKNDLKCPLTALCWYGIINKMNTIR